MWNVLIIRTVCSTNETDTSMLLSWRTDKNILSAREWYPKISYWRFVLFRGTLRRFVLFRGTLWRWVLTRRLFAGLLDTITTTADSKDCPGVCVHTLATLICYEVLENVKCPSPSMRCCVEPPPLPANGTTAVAVSNKVDQTTPAAASSARPQVSESSQCM